MFFGPYFPLCCVDAAIEYVKDLDSGVGGLLKLADMFLSLRHRYSPELYLCLAVTGDLVIYY